MKSNRFRNPIFSFFVAIGGLITAFSANAQELEQLYFQASEKAQQGDFEGALVIYTQIVTDLGEFGWSDFGPVFGGIYYDKGICHLQLKQYAEAQEAFRVCHEEYPNKPNDKKPDKPTVASSNMRWELAVFQQGYCEQVQGKFEEALASYEKFKELNPDPSVLQPIHAAYVLRRGVCLIGVDKLDEGEKEIRRLFDEFSTTFRGTSGQLLFQAMLDLANGWIGNAEENGEKVRDSAHSFLDQYGGLFSISPYDKANLGFVERLRLIGYQAQEAQLYDVALRFFTMVPTTESILEDLVARAEQSGGNQRAAYDKLIADYQGLIDSPDPPEVDTLRLIANCYEQMGNRRAGYVLNRFLVESYPDTKHMPDILHETARYAFALGDGAASQYFGDTFMEKYGDSKDVRIVKLRDNVATFMLQALFRNQKYAICADVAQRVRDEHEVGAPQRDMADYIYGASNYFIDQQEEAQAALDIHVENYPDSGNREAARFFQSSNRIVQGKYDEAAPMLDTFEQDYSSSTFLGQVRFDRATCYYIASDYVSALQYLEKVFEHHAGADVVDRAYLLKGDTIKVMSGTPLEGKDPMEYLAEAKEAFLAGLDSARRLDHKNFIEEALFKTIDVAMELEEFDVAIEHYDDFIENHKGSTWEAQVSVFAMPALAKANRADDGLAQLERMIVQLSEGDDSKLLQQSIGSHMTASIEHRGHDETVKVYDGMIAAGGNTNLQTWLMIHKIMVFQQKVAGLEKDSPERETVAGQIGGVFEKLTDFGPTNLSDIALSAVGEYLEEDNPFKAKPFFEELLLRPDKTFQAPAEMALGRIDSRSPEPSVVEKAVQRFRRVIKNNEDKVYDAKAFLPEAHIQIARITVGQKDWISSEEVLLDYANQKSWDAGNKERRAEGMYLLCYTLEMKGETDEAVSGYNKVYAAFPAHIQWAALSIERGFNLALTGEYKEEEKEAKRLQAYVFLRQALYSWQKFDAGVSDALDRLRGEVGNVEAELGLTADKIKEIEAMYGLDQEPK